MTASDRPTSPATLGSTGNTPRLSIGRLVVDVTVLSAAVLIRFAHVASSSFPLGDGGLFWTMVQSLQGHGYAIPHSVVYNGVTIPFAYPPLGFYATGLIADVSRAPDLVVLRLLPFVVACATVIVFWGLARAVLETHEAVVGAVFAFATLPLAYRYFVMGAGITRSPGLLFALVAIWMAYLLSRRRRLRTIALMGVAGGLTILSHPNAAWFAAYSCALIFVLNGRNRRALTDGLIGFAGALLVAGPWLITTLVRHGLTPFLAAVQSSNPGPPAIQLLIQLRITEEPLAPLLELVAVFGAVICLRERRWWLPAWLVLACLLDTRYSGTFAMVPLALLVGTAVSAFLHWLTLPPAHSLAMRFSRATTLGVAGWLALFPLVGALLPSAPLEALPASTLSAMNWVSMNTPLTARFVVIAPLGPSAGSESEWFPALAERRSIGTYQGTEWLPATGAISAWERYQQLQECAGNDEACLDNWANASGLGFDFVFLRTDGTASLRESLRMSAGFTLAYATTDVWIFARRGASPSAASIRAN
jgi:hypothetical protein